MLSTAFIRERNVSQKTRILTYLKTGKAITPLAALRLFGCFRLGARVWELRQAGHNIVKGWEEDGHKRWARYRLARRA